MKNLLPVILIVAAIIFGYEGYHQMQNTAELKIGDLKIEAGASGGKQTAYIFYGLGVVCLIAGLAMISKKGNLN